MQMASVPSQTFEFRSNLTQHASLGQSTPTEVASDILTDLVPFMLMQFYNHLSLDKMHGANSKAGFQPFGGSTSSQKQAAKNGRSGTLVGQTVENGFSTDNTATTDCNVFDHPDYDPYYYNDYCSSKYWCYKTYNADCTPSNAFGLTNFQVRFVMSFVLFTPWYIMNGLLNFLFAPFAICLFMADEYFTNALSICTLGIYGSGSTFTAN